MKLRDLAQRFRDTRSRLPWWSSHLLGVGFLLLALGVFLKLTREVFGNEELAAFDRGVMQWMAAHRTLLLNRVALDVTSLGSMTLVTLFTLGGLAFLLVGRDRRGALHLLLAVLGGIVLFDRLKAFFERPRPDFNRLIDASGYSYPSGHTVSAAVLYVTLAIVIARHFREPHYRKLLIGLAVFTTLLVGASRVYLGVHYLTDVTSGMAVGAAWAVLLASGFAYVEQRTLEVRKRLEAAKAAEEAAAGAPAKG